MTFKDLKKLVELPSYKEQRVPTAKALEVSGVPVVTEKVLENHGSIKVYQNGYVIYRAHKRVTVFSLRDCVHYKYDAAEGAGHHIEEAEFDDYEWHIRLVLEGEDRIFMNYEIIQGKWMPSREDREYKEEILEGVDEAVSTLERMISEEGVEELLSTLTDLQRKVVHIHLFHIPFGKLTIIQGNPGEGKTYFAMRLAAACTNRKPLPGMETLEPFNIIYQTAEDGLGDTVKPRLMEADADLERVLVIDDRDTPLTLADERIARAIRENNARLVIIDPMQAFLGADVDMNRANEVRPIFRSLGDIAQATGCAIVLIGHLNKAAGTQSTYRGLGSIDITAAVRSLLFIGKLKDSPTTRVLIHEKSSLAPPGQSLAFSLGDEKGFEWIGAYDITADELLAGTDTAKTESKTAQAQMLILELLADGKRMPSAELEKAVNERGISSRTMRTAKSRIGDRLVTEKDGTAWVCYLRN